MDGYSRMVAILKVLLPIAALVLLSTLFLVSRSVDPTTTIPFSQADIDDRLRDQQVTGPVFSGSTATGDEITLTAAVARPGAAGGTASAEALTGRINIAGGREVVLSADAGRFDPAADEASLAGSVRVETSDGYDVTTEELSASLSDLRVTAPGPVSGTAPFGRLSAGSMELSRRAEGGSAHLLFKDGVKLVYDPKQRER
jgi:lipopolysaccharide export system protein LptC